MPASSGGIRSGRTVATRATRSSTVTDTVTTGGASAVAPGRDVAVTVNSASTSSSVGAGWVTMLAVSAGTWRIRFCAPGTGASANSIESRQRRGCPIVYQTGDCIGMANTPSDVARAPPFKVATSASRMICPAASSAMPGRIPIPGGEAVATTTSPDSTPCWISNWFWIARVRTLKSCSR